MPTPGHKHFTETATGGRRTRQHLTPWAKPLRATELEFGKDPLDTRQSKLTAAIQ